ncbi:MAG: ABC transporter permease [Acidobacteria bacterium]|nr:ABC transporter permease [Acidobacteriota bacterium]
MKLPGLVLTEVRVILRSGGAYLWFFAMPLLFAFFFGLAFRGGGPTKTALNVLDRDGSFLSRSLVASLASDGFVIEARTPGQWKAGEWKPRGVEIPQGFARDVLAGRPTTLKWYKDPSGDTQRGAAAESRLQLAVFKLIGNLCLMETEAVPAPSPSPGVGQASPAAPSAEAPPASGTPSTASAAPDSTAADASRYARIAAGKPRVTVSESLAGRRAQFPTGFNQTIPAMVVQFVLMCLAIYGTNLLVEERDKGILRRASVGPVSAAGLLAVKLCSRIGMGLLQVVVLFLAGRLFFGIDLGSFLGIAVLMIAYSAAAAALSLLLATLVKDHAWATGVSILLTLVMSALGGCWWPLEVVTPVMRTVAFLFPTGWAMDAFHRIYSFGGDLPDIVQHVAVLAGMAAVFYALAARFFPRSLRT